MLPSTSMCSPAGLVVVRRQGRDRCHSAVADPARPRRWIDAYAHVRGRPVGWASCHLGLVRPGPRRMDEFRSRPVSVSGPGPYHLARPGGGWRPVPAFLDEVDRFGLARSALRRGTRARSPRGRGTEGTAVAGAAAVTVAARTPHVPRPHSILPTSCSKPPAISCAVASGPRSGEAPPSDLVECRWSLVAHGVATARARLRSHSCDPAHCSSAASGGGAATTMSSAASPVMVG